MGRKYRYKTRPYIHQVRALRKLLANGDGGELFCEPRTGKSKIIVDYASVLALKGEVDKVVIVCPARVMDVWVEQFHLHCPMIFHTTVWDARARKAGPPPPARGTYDLNVVIVNYDAFSTPGRRTKSGRRSRASGRYKVRSVLQKWMHSTRKKTMMVLDESHRIASPSGSAANMIVTMQRDAEYRVLATGTPVTKAKKAHDLYMQYKFRAPERFGDLRTSDDFKNAFGRWIHDNGYPQWIGPKNQAILQKRIHKTGIVVRREDCFDLPPRQTEIIRVPLTTSASVYDQMAAEMVAKIIVTKQQMKDADESEARVHFMEASIRLVQTLRLRQITGGVATTDEGKLIRIGREKIEALRPILEAHVEHDEKLVICGQFRADLAAIERVCRREFKLPTFVLKGGVSRDQATADLREFKRLDGAGVFVVQPQSGAEGIDLSSAAHIVHYSLTPSFVKYTQMNDRIALSPVSTTYTYLLGQDTVDEVLYDVLQTDGEVTRKILDKPESLIRANAEDDLLQNALAALEF
jgi:SNF2 family DNA or RNA helicase